MYISKVSLRIFQVEKFRTQWVKNIKLFNATRYTIRRDFYWSLQITTKTSFNGDSESICCWRGLLVAVQPRYLFSRQNLTVSVSACVGVPLWSFREGGRVVVWSGRVLWVFGLRWWLGPCLSDFWSQILSNSAYIKIKIPTTVVRTLGCLQSVFHRLPTSPSFLYAVTIK